MHSGSDEVAQFVREREGEWRWWDNPAVVRPMVSVVALRSGDDFEAGRPERGVALRVRCAWENTAQGLPKNPLAELAVLTVDGRAVTPELVTRKRPNGQTEEHFHRWAISEPAPGPHQAVARVRVLATGEEVVQTVEFAG
jgi:hypothetical protein